MNVLQIVGYAAAGLAIIVLGSLLADKIMDWLRAKFGIADDPVSMAFDKFVDEMRKILGDGPLSNITREAIASLAGMAWDQAENVLGPIVTKKRFVEMVLGWYDREVAIEQAVRLSYSRVILPAAKARIKDAK